MTAFLEATIAGMFRALEDMVRVEIEWAKDPDEFFANPDDRFYWRQTMLVPFELAGGNDPENFEDGEEPLTVDCDDESEWNIVSEMLEASVLWDADYELEEFDDLDSQEGSLLKELYMIGENYYSSIPQDPKLPAAKKLLKATADLCDAVAEREEKAMETSVKIA